MSSPVEGSILRHKLHICVGQQNSLSCWFQADFLRSLGWKSAFFIRSSCSGREFQILPSLRPRAFVLFQPDSGVGDSLIELGRL